jgi:hypothetical protein
LPHNAAVLRNKKRLTKGARPVNRGNMRSTGMIETAERQKRQRAAFVTDEEQRLFEIEDMRLVVKFGDKKRYSDREYEAIYQELAEAGLVGDAWHDLDAIEAVFKKLNAIDEAIAARRALGG